MTLEVPYHHRLVQIRAILEETLTDFPNDWCSESTRVVGLNLGLKELIGYKLEKNSSGGICRAYHTWNYDLER